MPEAEALEAEAPELPQMPRLVWGCLADSGKATNRNSVAFSSPAKV